MAKYSISGTVKKMGVSILFMLATHLVHSQGLDLDITKAINPQNPGSRYWKATTSSAFYVGGAIPLGLLTAGFIGHDPDLKKKSYEIFGALAIEFLVSEPIKYLVNRPRPAVSHPGVIFPYEDLRGKSFPSGHSSMAFATAASLAIQYRKWYVTVPAYLWAASVAYSRVYLGVHYSSDVLAGAAIGIGSAYLAHWLNRRWFTKRVCKPAI